MCWSVVCSLVVKVEFLAIKLTLDITELDGCILVFTLFCDIPVPQKIRNRRLML